MCHWKKWIWPGILTIAILSVLALWMKADFIEKDLTAKANQVLAERGQTWAKVEMDGRDATIVGLAPSEASQAEAEFTVDDPAEVYDVRVVANNSQLMAAQSPYILSANRTGDKVELTGFTPDEATRATVLASAKDALPNVEIIDKMELARGAPEGYAAMAGFGFTQLAGLSTGEMSLENENLSLKGAASDRDTFDGINTALASAELPGGAKLALKDITAPSASPYIWNADYDGEKLKLAGFVPSDEARQSVIASAKAALPNAEIIDEQKLASGQPEGFTAAAGFALQQLPRFTSGNVGLSDLDLSVAGVAESTANYTTALGAVGAALPAGIALANSDIKPASISPYTWGAEYNGEKVTLSGYVPDSATRQSVVAKAGSVLSGAEIVDTMQIAAGVPNGFSAGTDFALEQLPRFSSGMVGLSDLDLTVKGVAKDSASYQAANSAVAAALPASMNLADKQIVPATISPYTWSADYDGSSVVLSGFVPDSGSRAVINEAVKTALPEASVEDKMAIAAGAPASFAGATSFGVDQLKRFSSGSASLSDLDFSVKGVALDSAAYTEAKSVVASALPADMKLASEEIVPATVSPYQWNAEYSGDAVTLGGYVPNDEARASILSAVGKALPDAKVTDGMQIANGAPEGFVNAARFSSNQLTRFSSGSVALSDRALAVRGVALDSPKYTAAKAAVDGGLPADMTLASENIVPPSVSPYTWNADYTGDTVTLNGFVPDSAARDSLLAETKSRLPAATIVDKMQIAAGAPSDFESASKGAIAVLPRFSSGDVALSDLDLTVNGVAKTPADYPAANTYVQGTLPGGSKLAQANITPPAVDGAYIWTARKNGNEITVSGMVPNAKAKSAIARGAKSLNPGATVIDEQEIVTGSPKGFLSNTRNGLGLLNKMKSGTVSISDDTVGVVGFSNSVNDHEMAITQVAKAPVAGAKWVQRDITPPTIKPFTWAIVKGDEKAELSGFVPNRGVGNTNVAATKAVLEKEVDDKQRVGGGAPAEFGNAVAALVSGVDRLDNSRGSITGENVFIQGRTSSEANADKIRSEIAASLPGNYKFRDQISYPLPKPEPKPAPKPEPVVEVKPAVCEVDFAGIFGDEKILFDTARAVIKEESNDLLNKLAAGLKECPNAKVEIGGHTDSRGSASYNQGLSEARAQAVVAYMIKSGASADNLVAKGYGEANPIASNNLPADRAKNRRIEFKVISAN